ncbi:CBS domain protein [uncultured archaeon]|nr:CBS domain protein [uncultured archaeon]
MFPDLKDIERRRKKLGLTQTELAEKAGVSQSLVARIESGSVDPRYNTVVRLFTALEGMKGKEVTAAEIMTGDVVGVQADNPLESAASKMKEFGVSQMPVYDGDQIIGSISERAILAHIASGTKASALSARKTRDIMEDAFPTVRPETPISVLSVLLEHNTAALVTEHGETQGIITNSDLLKVLHK